MATVNEPFLVNPPKRKLSRRGKKVGKAFTWRPPSAKALGKEGTKHRPVVYSVGGHWTTPFSARIAQGGKRLNPLRRRRRAKRNPFGEEAMLVGFNPRRSKMALFGRRRRKSNPKRHRRYRRNPANFTKLTSVMPAVLGGAAGAIGVKWLPRVLGVSSGLMYYGIQIGTVLGGGWLAGKMVSKNVSDGWVIGSAAVIVTDLLSGVLSPLGLAGLSAFPEMGPSLEGMGAMPTYSEPYAAYSM